MTLAQAPQPASAGASPAVGSAPAPDHDVACHQAAKELRLQHPRWIVLWISGTGRYHAYPLYTQRSLILTAEQPAELAALMEQAEQAARRPRPAITQARYSHSTEQAMNPGYDPPSGPPLRRSSTTTRTG